MNKSKTSEFAVAGVFAAGFLLGNILEYKRIMGFELSQLIGIGISIALVSFCYVFLRRGYK